MRRDRAEDDRHARHHTRPQRPRLDPERWADRLAGDADALAAARLQFRVTALLLASCPATTMGDLMPKVLVAAMIRAGVEGEEPSYTLDMVERAITCDVRRLQGPLLSELA